MLPYSFQEGPPGRNQGGTREWLLASFRHPQNVAALRRALREALPPGPQRAAALEGLAADVEGFEPRGDFAMSDPLAQRGPEYALGEELQRLNAAYLEHRVAFLPGDDAGPAENEPYHYRAFVEDSLAPPGLESLNRPPLDGLREEQYPLPPPGGDPEDAGWDEGDPDRTAAEAAAEYWGCEDKKEGGWFAGDGGRFMRYPQIPFWQNLSRGRDYDRDIEETLGFGERESATHVRRWGGLRR